MEILDTLVALLDSSKYVLIFLGSFTEGAFVMMTGGILWQQGQTEFWPTYAALLAGDFISDLMWYGVGYLGARQLINRFGPYVGLTPKTVEKIQRRFNRFRISILIISKLTNGFGTGAGTILVAGMLRVPLFAFALVSFVGGTVWVFMVMFIGYYFGNVIDVLPPGTKIAAGVLGIIVLALIVRYVNRRLAKVA
jgi:membrane protein DedA with SNARE-associated domain